jgi:hypothetical protein
MASHNFSGRKVWDSDRRGYTLSSLFLVDRSLGGGRGGVDMSGRSKDGLPMYSI